MITATNVNSQLASAAAAPAVPGEPASPEGAADFLLELQAALGMPVQAPPATLAQAQPEAEGDAPPESESDELQNLPTAGMAPVVAPAIFASPVAQVAATEPSALALEGVSAAQAASAQATTDLADQVPTPDALAAPSKVMTSAEAIASAVPQDAQVAASAAMAPDLAAMPEAGAPAAVPAVLAQAQEPGLALAAAQTDTAAEAASKLDAGVRDLATSVPAATGVTGETAENTPARPVAAAQVQSGPAPVAAEAEALAVPSKVARTQEASATATEPTGSLLAAATVQAPAADEVDTAQLDTPVPEALNASAKTGLSANTPEASLVLARAEAGAASASPLAPAANTTVLESSHRMPIEPHHMRLDTGPVQTEVLKLVRQGGGQIVLELTPPDQGSYRLDLRLDLQGRAQLIVDGASDSVRTRLEQGEAVLREQLAQMGLDLQLNYQQQDRGLASSNDASSFAAQAAEDRADAPSLTADAAGRRERARAGNEGGLVHLYA